MTSTPKFNTKSPTMRRILREAAELSNSPSPDYTATPLETDLFEWHFTFRGPPNSVYSEGIYHGRIVLPPTYPLRPPSFRFVTPSGRFEANREICLSISGHHEETWQPAWGVRTALVALRSFMETDPKGQLGGLETNDSVRKRLAAESHSFRCATCAKTNLEIIQECERTATHQEGSSATPGEIEIPSELKMGWKDEMERPRSPVSQSSKTGLESSGANSCADEETAILAEGFVQTAAVGSSQRSDEVSASTKSVHLASRPRGTTIASQDTLQRPPALETRHIYIPVDDGVPLWVDRTIVVLVILLISMVLKVMVGI